MIPKLKQTLQRLSSFLELKRPWVHPRLSTMLLM
jgi:hypothetical protein